jgi:DNA polymerase-3 subunit delta'
MFPDFAQLPSTAGAHRVPVYGHDAATAALRGAAIAGRAAQAYLFTGPPGIGKRTVARWFAQLLLCTADDASLRPCGHCRACRLSAADGWPDLHRLPVPLRIEAVRELQHDLALAPSASAHRVAILPEVELASLGAINSLLKTLEEPPRQVVLLLTSGDAGAVLPTVRSRCQVLQLRPLGVAQVTAALAEGWGQDSEQAELLARLAGGRLGWAVRSLSDETVLADRDAWLAGLARARGADVAARLALAAELARNAEGLPAGLATWSAWWRDVLLSGQGLATLIVNRDRAEEVAGAAARYAAGQVVAALRALESALRALAAKAGPQLTLEVLLLELP